MAGVAAFFSGLSSHDGVSAGTRYETPRLGNWVNRIQLAPLCCRSFVHGTPEDPTRKAIGLICEINV